MERNRSPYKRDIDLVAQILQTTLEGPEETKEKVTRAAANFLVLGVKAASGDALAGMWLRKLELDQVACDHLTFIFQLSTPLQLRYSPLNTLMNLFATKSTHPDIEKLFVKCREGSGSGSGII